MFQTVHLSTSSRHIARTHKIHTNVALDSLNLYLGCCANLCPNDATVAFINTYGTVFLGRKNLRGEGLIQTLLSNRFFCSNTVLSK